MRGVAASEQATKMLTKHSRYYLSDLLWKRVKKLAKRARTSLLIGQDHRRRGRPPKDDRLMVEAIFYVLRTAVAWRDLPACYGPWKSVYTRWRRWCALGLWQEILRLLSRRAEGCVRFIDGSHVKL